MGDFMKQGAKEQAKGKFHEVKGKIKDKVGRATKNHNLEVDGQDEKVSGKVQKKMRQLEELLGE